MTYVQLTKTQPACASPAVQTRWRWVLWTVSVAILSGWFWTCLVMSVHAQTPQEEALLRASNAGSGDYFGRSVSIDGDRAIVGAPIEDGATNGTLISGAAYVFERDATGTWQEVALLRSSNAGELDRFGESVSLDGDRAIIGAYFEDGTDDGLTNSGAAYVFQRDGSGTWHEVALLRASNAGAFDNFGVSVAIDGDRAIVGARNEDGAGDGLSSSGAAYVFERDDSGTWHEVALLRASNAGSYDDFGRSVSIDGDQAIVGALSEDGAGDGLTDSGAAYVFERDGSGTWHEVALLRASNAGEGDSFGWSVSIDGDRAIVGVLSEDGAGDGLSRSGAAYVFERDGSGTWHEVALLRASNAGERDSFGEAVAISGDRAVVGAIGEDGQGNGLTNSGVAYVFALILPAPSGLASTAGTNQVDLSWDAVGTATGYTVYRSTASFDDIAAATKLTASPVSDTTYADADVVAGTTYYYRVTAIDGVGTESALSNEVSATPQAAEAGSFSAQKIIDDQAGGAFDVYAADLTGTGLPDVIAAARNADEVKWYRNLGSGQFDAGQVIASGGDGPSSITAADLDGDGDRDVVVAYQFDNTVAWYANQFGESGADSDGFGPQQVIANDAGGAFFVAAGDLEADSDADIVVANNFDGSLVWYENRLNESTPGFNPTVINNDVEGTEAVFLADMNGDSHLDVLVAVRPNREVVVHSNDGTGGFGTGQSISGPGPVDIFAEDLDGDDQLDFIASFAFDDDNNEWTTQWLPNSGSSFSSENAIESKIDRVNFWTVHADDLDGDGKADILLATQDENKVAWYDNQIGESGSDSDGFGAEQVITTSANGVRTVFAADLDGDGDVDVLSASSGDDKVAWYENLTIENTAPVAEDDAATTPQDTEVEIDVLANDTPRADLDPNQIRIATPPSDGTAVPDGTNGTIIYTPDAGFLGVDTFAYTVKTPAGLESNEATVTVTVEDTPPAAPTGLAAAAGDGEVDLLWDSNTESDIASYTVHRSTTSGFTPGDNNRIATVTHSTGGISAIDSEASNGTTYYYRVVAIDETDNESPPSDEVSATPAATPTAANDIAETTPGTPIVIAVLDNDEPSGLLDPATVTVVSSPENGTASVEVTTGTITYTPNTGFLGTDTFTYTVNDDLGTTSNEATVSVTVGEDTPPAVITGLSTTAGDGAVDLSWDPSSAFDFASYRVYQRTSPAPSDQLGPPIHTTPGGDASATSYTATGLTNGTLYVFYVTAVDQAGLESEPAVSRSVPQAGTLPIQRTISFGPESEVTSFRMVGLPGDPDETPISSTLNGTGGEDWTAFYAPGITDSNQLVEYTDNPSVFTFTSGQGFWVLSTSTWDAQGEVDALDLSDATATVSLPSGWSILTNPFDRPVPWDDVAAANPGFDGEPYGYDGSYSIPESLRPYEGYYIFNDPSAPVDDIMIPYPENGSGSSAASARESSAPADSAAPSDRLRLNARSGSVTAEVAIRVGEDARSGRDAFDRFAPPGLGGTLTLALYNDEVLREYPWLNREARPLEDPGTTFDVRLLGPADQPVTLEATDLNGFGSNEIYLFDPDAARFYDLRSETARVTLRSASSEVSSTESTGMRALQVLVGPTAFIEAQKEAQLPIRFDVEPPYPNPFTQQVALPYTIPRGNPAVDVEITVYNILGQVVQRAIQTGRGPGRHIYQWDAGSSGRPLASGMYFGRLTVEGETIGTQKMVLIR